MSGLKIYTSNRLEILLDCLADVVKIPLASPLTPEIIVVQSRGMERWMSLEIAKRHGICANIRFPFPNAFLEDIFRILMPDMPLESSYEPGNLTFRIFKILPACLHRPAFQSLKTYLSDDPKKQKLFQLSEKLAELFDHYLVFRPQMILSWDKGGANHWQAELWREVAGGNETTHRAIIQKTLLDRITKNRETTDMAGGGAETLPERVSIFGISYLPPFHMEVIAAVSNLIQVNFFLMNPCRAYWGDIVTDKEKKRIQKMFAHATDTDETLYLEKGNRLLASMGVLGRDFFELICGFDFEIIEKFEDPPPKNLLASVQSDILNLIDRGESPSSADLFEMQESDPSIQIHSCHSPMREIEVLYDNLLAMFDEIPDLLPKDIVVMTPDIESYEPYIHAVFGSQTDDRLRIPYSISDLTVLKESRLISGFLNILDLKDSRFGVSQVLGLFESPGVREKFGLTDTDLEVAENWIRGTQIRWGIDAESRMRFGVPGFDENTWRTGIERLLLGYAMPGRDKQMFSGILPYDNVEGEDANRLGKFLEYLELLFAAAGLLNHPKSLKGWSIFFNKLLEQFFLTDDRTIHEIQVLRCILDEMSRKAEDLGFDDNIELEVVRSYLSHRLERTYLGSGFISGGVTFCAMLPMRSIPFKIICLLGMNNDAFPRDSKALGFDLIARNPKPGDRSRRNDDKYLFLEAILSVRETLYISYVGQSIQDNTAIPPSVLVSELLDYMEDGFGIYKEDFVQHHRLQAFSPDYFKKDSKFFSYSKENFSAAGRVHEGKRTPPFISTNLTVPPDEWKRLEPGTLCDFYSHPAKFLLQKRLGIYLEEAASVISEEENFGLEPLERYLIGQDLVKNRLTDGNLKAVFPVQKAKGVLPHGNVGEVAYREMSIDANSFVTKLESHLKEKSRHYLDIDLEIAGFRVSGRLMDIVDRKMIRSRYANTRAKDLLHTWICHLLLGMLPDKIYSQSTALICKNAVWEFHPVPNPGETLENLLHLYWKGLQEPVHFFPESSHEYAKQVLVKEKPLWKALKAAKNKWVGSDFQRGESQDPYFDLCFKNVDPIDDSFQQIAETVFSTLLENCTEVKINY